MSIRMFMATASVHTSMKIVLYVSICAGGVIVFTDKRVPLRECYSND